MRHIHSDSLPSKQHHRIPAHEKPCLQWYAIETRWSRSDAPTVKKQRFSVIQEALLHVRDLRDHLRVSAPLPMLPLSILPGTAHSTCEQRATEFSAFLAAAVAAPQLRITPPLLLLLAPDDTALEQCACRRHCC